MSSFGNNAKNGHLSSVGANWSCPADELRVLRARIAELERLQQQERTTVNSPTPSEDSFDLVMLQNELIDELMGSSSSNNNNIDDHRIESDGGLAGAAAATAAQLAAKPLAAAVEAALRSVAAHEEQRQQAAMVGQLAQQNGDNKNETLGKKNDEVVSEKQQQQQPQRHQLGQNDGNAKKEEEKEPSYATKKCLSQLKLATDAQQQEMQAKVAKLDGLVNVLSIKALRDGLTLRNRWDIFACHGDLLLIEPTRLAIVNCGTVYALRTAFAKLPVPRRGFFYYEVKLLEGRSQIAIGMSAKTPLAHEPHQSQEGNSTAAAGLGTSADRFAHHSMSAIRKKVALCVGDTVGFGVDMDTLKILYTKNGRRLATSDMCVVSILTDLFPSVLLFYPGTKIETNFGPTFEFPIGNEV